MKIRYNTYHIIKSKWNSIRSVCFTYCIFVWVLRFQELWKHFKVQWYILWLSDILIVETRENMTFEKSLWRWKSFYKHKSNIMSRPIFIPPFTILYYDVRCSIWTMLRKKSWYSRYVDQSIDFDNTWHSCVDCDKSIFILNV